jgi:hypothetical protein
MSLEVKIKDGIFLRLEHYCQTSRLLGTLDSASK